MFDLLADLASLPGPDLVSAASVKTRASKVLRPEGAFARLDDIAAWLAGWQRTPSPRVARPAALLFAADHGVVHRQVSAYPATVTKAMVDAIEAGSATSSVLARQVGADLRIIDVGVGSPTGDIVDEDALDEARFQDCVTIGRATVAEVDADLVVLGEMGIGNTTAAAAVAAALFGGSVIDWVGRGTGLDDAGLDRKRTAVGAALNRLDPVSGPFDVLRRVGGAELAALMGACLEARLRSTPILLDGFVVTAAVAPLAVAAIGALDHCLAAHLSPEPGHRLLLGQLGLRPLLDLELRLGEGTGGLLAIPLVRAAAAAVVEVATFEEAGLG